MNFKTLAILSAALALPVLCQTSFADKMAPKMAPKMESKMAPKMEPKKMGHPSKMKGAKLLSTKMSHGMVIRTYRLADGKIMVTKNKMTPKMHAKMAPKMEHKMAPKMEHKTGGKM